MAVPTKAIANFTNYPNNYSYTTKEDIQYDARQKDIKNMLDARKEATESLLYEKCLDKEREKPPKYPIRVTYNINDNIIYKIDDLLYDNTDNGVSELEKKLLEGDEKTAKELVDKVIFVSSFDEAQKEVENDINSENSYLMAKLKEREFYKFNDYLKKLRLSSHNRSYFRPAGYTERPDGEYKLTTINESIPCWNIYISYAEPTLISSMRIDRQNSNNTGGKKRRKTKKRRGKKSKRVHSAKKSNVSTYKKGRVKK